MQHETGKTKPVLSLASEHKFILDLIPDNSRVLDLGCGNGDLLGALMKRPGIRAEGIEISPDCIQECVAKGLSNIHQADLDKGLEDYADQSMDYVILTNTIQVLHRPLPLIQDMARVGKNCIIGFSNFAHWRARIQLGLFGQMPKTSRLPYEWYDTPNIHLTTIKDFQAFCKTANLHVVEQIALRTGSNGYSKISLLPNLLGDYAIFVVSATQEASFS